MRSREELNTTKMTKWQELLLSTTTLNVNGLNFQYKNKEWQVGLKSKTQPFVAFKKCISVTKVNTGLY
jgi:hypothetical protein